MTSFLWNNTRFRSKLYMYISNPENLSWIHVTEFFLSGFKVASLIWKNPGKSGLGGGDDLAPSRAFRSMLLDFFGPFYSPGVFSGLRRNWGIIFENFILLIQEMDQKKISSKKKYFFRDKKVVRKKKSGKKSEKKISEKSKFSIRKNQDFRCFRFSNFQNFRFCFWNFWFFWNFKIFKIKNLQD